MPATVRLVQYLACVFRQGLCCVVCAGNETGWFVAVRYPPQSDISDCILSVFAPNTTTYTDVITRLHDYAMY